MANMLRAKILTITASAFISLSCSGPSFSVRIRPEPTFASRTPALANLAQEERWISNLDRKNGPYTKQQAATELTKYYIETNQWSKIRALLNREDANVKVSVLSIFANRQLIITQAQLGSFTPVFVNLLSSPDQTIRKLSANALETLALNNFDISSAVSKLEKSLSDTDGDVVVSAAHALYPHYARLKDRAQIQRLNLFLYFREPVRNINTDVKSMATELSSNAGACDLGSSDEALYESGFRLLADLVHDAAHFGLDLSPAVPILNRIVYDCDVFKLTNLAASALTEHYINQRNWETIANLLESKSFFEYSNHLQPRRDGVLETLYSECDSGTPLPANLKTVIRDYVDGMTPNMGARIAFQMLKPLLIVTPMAPMLFETPSSVPDPPSIPACLSQ